ncbi:MAG: rod shape-determining protein MreC [Clostridia bacterium]|nr:rod shape-determining protein MreC [Clostridia bacterium]
MKEFWKSKAAKILAVVAVLLIGLMIYAASTNGFSSIPASVTGVIITPLQNLWSAMTDGISGLFADLTANSRQIKDMQAEIDRLHELLADYDQRVEENKIYREFLGIKENNPDFQFTDGRVIASDPSDPYHNFTINAGSLKDVQPGDPVITAQGLVGTVYQVGPTWAKVRSILDPTMQISATVTRVSENCVTSGSVTLAQDGLLRAELLPRYSGAAVGDTLITSGISETYPAGLLIGNIVSVSLSSDGASTTAIISPYANFSSLSSVLVLISYSGKEG